jgi:hypothetical protein
MSIKIRFMPLCAVILFTGLRSVAAHSTMPSTQAVVVPPATQALTAVDHATYTQRAEGEMHEWELKMNAFYERAKANGERDGTAADAKGLRQNKRIGG